MAKETHPHAAALDRIGRRRVIAHFNVTEGAYSNWKKRGVPRYYVASVRTLAAVNGVQVPEMYIGGEEA